MEVFENQLGVVDRAQDRAAGEPIERGCGIKAECGFSGDWSVCDNHSEENQ